MPDRRLVSLVVAGVAASALAGCARVPDHSGVHAGNAVQINAPDDFEPRVLVRPPPAGAKPDEVVAGFLVASAGFESDHAVARTYLTAAAARSWRPSARELIYDDTNSAGVSAARVSGAARVVSLHDPLVATIGRDGGYTAAGVGAQVRVDFRLVRQQGEWRISNPPAGVLLTTLDLSRSLRAQPVYFLDRSLSLVVPDNVFFAVTGPGLSTALMRALLGGPTSWLAPAVRTAVPAGTTLLGTVPVDEHGTATVDLSQQVLDASGPQRERLSAQIVWTLRGVPGVARVRLLAEGNPLDVPGSGGAQSRDAWPTYDPTALSSSTGGYYRSGNRLVFVNGGPVPGPLGHSGTSLEHVALSPDLSLAGGLRSSGGRTTVYAGSLAAGPRRVLSAAATFTPPSWDAAGEMWTVELTPTPQVLLIRPGAPVVRVRAPALDGLDLRELRVSRDGTRVAVVAGVGPAAELLIGRVRTTADGALRLDGFRAPDPSLTDVGSVTWADPTSLLVLGRSSGGARIPWLVDVDGSSVGPVTTTGLAAYAALAGAPGQPTLVAAGAEIYQAAHGLWTPVARGSEPAYPG